VLSAIRKNARGESLTARETSAYRRYLANQETKFLDRWLPAVPQKVICRIFGVKTKQLQDMARRLGLAIDGKTTNLPLVGPQMWKWWLKAGKHLSEDEAILLGPNSPMRDQYLAVKIEREKLAHQKDLGVVRSLEEIQGVWQPFTAALRQACERIQRQNLAGAEAVEAIRESVSAGERSLAAIMESENESTDDSYNNNGDSDSKSPVASE
jgi:hypothetical protein